MKFGKKRFTLKIFLGLMISTILLTASGCGTTLSQIKPTEMPVAKQSVSYVVPKKPDNIINSLSFNGASTYTEFYQSQGIDGISGIKVYSNNNYIVMTDYNGQYFTGNGGSIASNTYASFARYIINVNTKEGANNYIVTFTIGKKQIAIGKSPIGVSYHLPIFSENKVMKILKSASFSYKISATSPYNTASTYDNFVRLLKHQSYKKGHKFMGKIYKQGFYLPIRNFNGNVKLFVSDYAYQNGSMAVVDVKVNLSGNQNTNTINIANIVHKINKKIKKVVKGNL
ncbi:MAG: hypothetical protein ACYCTB_03305 [bacterium]